MAWIQVHQNLFSHPKLLMLSRDINEDRLVTMSRLILLWWWALDVTRDGALLNCDARVIATVMSWNGDAEVLLRALINNGWIDENTDGCLSIHDWKDYGGKFTIEREQARERQKRYRNAHVTRNTSVTSPSDDAYREDKNRLQNNNKETSKKVETETLLPSWIEQETWDGFIAMRRKIRKPMTDYAKKLMVEKLTNARVAGHDANELLKEATINSWQSVVIRPKFGGNGHKTGGLDGTNRQDNQTGGQSSGYSDDPEKYIKGKYGNQVQP